MKYRTLWQTVGGVFLVLTAVSLLALWPESMAMPFAQSDDPFGSPGSDDGDEFSVAAGQSADRADVFGEQPPGDDPFSAAAVRAGGASQFAENSSPQLGQAAAARAVRGLAEQIRQGDEGRGGTARLRKMVDWQLVQQLERQRAELAELKRRLNQLEAAISSRERNRDRIVERRVEELLDPSVEWESRGNSATRTPEAGSNDSQSSPANRQQDSPFASNEFTSTDSAFTNPFGSDFEPRRTSAAASPLEWTNLLRARRQQMIATVQKVMELEAQSPSDPQARAYLEARADAALRSWREHWEEFAAQLRRCELDLQAAQAELVGVRKQYEISKAQFDAGDASHSELIALETRMRTTEIAVQRASAICERFAEIASENADLNPGKFNRDEVTQAPQWPTVATDELSNDELLTFEGGTADLSSATGATLQTTQQPDSARRQWPQGGQTTAVPTPVAEWSTVVELLSRARDRFERSVGVRRRILEQRAESIRLLHEEVAETAELVDQEKVPNHLSVIRHRLDLLQREKDEVLERMIQQTGEPPSYWRQAWTYYQHNIKLLELDLQEADYRFEAANAERSRMQRLFETGAASDAQHSAAVAQAQIAKLQLERAEERLGLYQRVVEEEPGLDPENRKTDELKEAIPEVPEELKQVIQSLEEKEAAAEADPAADAVRR